MLRKIAFITCYQCLDVVVHDVNLPVDVQCLAWLYTREPEIGMEASAHPLKQFLVWLPSNAKNPFVVATETAD